MRIISAKIGSFGSAKDKGPVEFGPNMNLVFGENESGKTTLMEFIRGTIFPVRKKTYPANNARTDAGEVLIEKKDGTLIKMKKEDKTSFSDMDPSTYRSIYAMTPEDLRDSDIISSGDIKSRFLTIPGGKDLPNIIESIDKEMNELANAERRSETKLIGKKLSELKQVSDLLNTPHDSERYDALFRERSELEKQLATLRSKDKKYNDLRGILKIQRSQSGNIELLNELISRVEELSASSVVKENDKERYNDLKLAVNEKEGVLSSIVKKETDARESLGMFDAESVIENKVRIKELTENTRHMSELMSRRSYLNTMPSNTPVSREKPIKSNNIAGYILIVLGVLSAVAAFVTGIYILFTPAILIPVGLLLILRRSGNKTGSANITGSRDNNDALRAVNEEIAFLEKTLADVMLQLNAERSSFAVDVAFLSDLLEKGQEYRRLDLERNDADRNVKNARTDLGLFVSAFGGEEQFLALNKQKEERLILEQRISELKESISRSGYDPNTVIEEGTLELMDVSKEISDSDKRLWEITSEMKAILNDEERERLMDSRASLRSEVSELAKRWGTLALAMNIIDSACDDLYSTVQPGVISAADGYVKIMTGGRYGLNIDPRSSDISVVSGNEGKAEGQWSSGLGDQIKLSIKLAIAKELSEEQMPILLDDVLLTFDSKRKKGGCKALIDASKDAQIILFTCDKETKELMIEEGCETIINL
jgi:Uncharacterized conserved protein